MATSPKQTVYTVYKYATSSNDTCMWWRGIRILSLFSSTSLLFSKQTPFPRFFQERETSERKRFFYHFRSFKVRVIILLLRGLLCFFYVPYFLRSGFFILFTFFLLLLLLLCIFQVRWISLFLFFTNVVLFFQFLF